MTELTEASKKIRREMLMHGVYDAMSAAEILVALNEFAKEDDKILTMLMPEVFLPYFIPSNCASSGVLVDGLRMATVRKEDKIRGRIIVVIDNAAIRSGDFWAALIYGRDRKLDNLTILADYCGVEDASEQLNSTNLRQIGMYAGWAATCVDGHHIPSIVHSLEWTETVSTPTLIIANTIAGRGISFLERAGKSKPNPLTQHIPGNLELAREELA